MEKKRYTIKTACPQCGCTDLTVLTPEEIKKKYGDAPNVDMECNACVLKYSTDMEKACPEWDKECKMKGQPGERGPAIVIGGPSAGVKGSGVPVKGKIVRTSSEILGCSIGCLEVPSKSLEKNT